LSKTTIRRREQCAEAVVETVPLVMQAVRAELRRSPAVTLSQAQLRALGYLGRHADSPLSALAEALGLGLPTASRLMDGLVRGGYVERQTAARDRRCARLALTGAGREALEAALAQVQAALTADLDALADEEVTAVATAMGALRRIFGDSAA
jgi:DNA-binding MarR family transcriptional regulator